MMAADVFVDVDSLYCRNKHADGGEKQLIAYGNDHVVTDAGEFDVSLVFRA